MPFTNLAKFLSADFRFISPLHSAAQCTERTAQRTINVTRSRSVATPLRRCRKPRSWLGKLAFSKTAPLRLLPSNRIVVRRRASSVLAHLQRANSNNTTSPSSIRIESHSVLQRSVCACAILVNLCFSVQSFVVASSFARRLHRSSDAPTKPVLIAICIRWFICYLTTTPQERRAALSGSVCECDSSAPTNTEYISEYLCVCAWEIACMVYIHSHAEQRRRVYAYTNPCNRFVFSCVQKSKEYSPVILYLPHATINNWSLRLDPVCKDENISKVIPT